MIIGSRANWQTIIADLALILFMVTASSVDMDRDTEQASSDSANAVGIPAEGETLAIYRADRSGPSLEQWLETQASDSRQHLTVVARLPAGEREKGLRSALDLASSAGAYAPQARIVIEPGEQADVFAVLSFDGRDNWHADCTPEDITGASRATPEDETCD